MNISEKTIDICEELSTDGNIIKPYAMSTEAALFPDGGKQYYGFMPKKRFQLLKKPPIFQMNEHLGRITITSFSRDHDVLIEDIARRNGFEYKVKEPDSQVIFL